MTMAGLRVTRRLHRGRLIEIVTPQDQSDHAIILDLAARYRRAAVPGVVTVTSFQGDPDPTLVLALPGDESWETLPPALGRLVVAGERLAMVLDQLHQRGVTHGALSARSVLVDRRGEPVLCGFAAEPSSAAEDVRDLARLIRTLAQTGPARTASERQFVDRVTRACDRSAAKDQPTAAGFAARLAQVRQPASRWSRVIVSTAVLGLGLVGLVWGRHPDEPTPRTSAAAEAAPPNIPAPTSASSVTATPTTAPLPSSIATTSSVAVGAPPTVVHQGRVWAAGRPGDIAVVADWTCDQRPAVTVARPGTGEVFLWRGWPVGGSEAGERLGVIPSLTGFAEPPVETCGWVTVMTETGRRQILLGGDP